MFDRRSHDPNQPILDLPSCNCPESRSAFTLSLYAQLMSLYR